MPAVAEVQFKATNSQSVVTAFNSIGTAAGQASTKLQQFTAGTTTKLQQFTSSLNSIKSQGDPFSNLTNNLNSFNKSVDQSSQKATTFGQKLKNFGSQFGSSIASIGALGGTILGLSRQYQDLGDTQIAVEKAQRRVSTAQEAVQKTTTALATATAKYGAGSAQAKQAALDLQQAQSQLSINTQLLTERTEDHQRAQENFWIGLVPTVTTAGASIVSVLNDIGGTKGIGGLKTALGGLKSAFNVFTGAGGLASGLTGIGNAASGSVTGLNGMATATTGLGTAMKGMALAALPVAVAIGGVALVARQAGQVIHTIVSVMKGDMLEAVKSMENTIALVEKVGPALGPFGGIQTSVFTALRPEIQKFRAELEKVPSTIKPIPPALQGVDDAAQGINGAIDNLVGSVLGLTRHADAAKPALQGTGNALSGVGTAASEAAPPIVEVGNAVAEVSGQFATITNNIGPATTGIAGLNAQMNPFRVTIQGLTADQKANADALSFLKGWFDQVTSSTAAYEKATARAKTQAAQLNPVLEKTAIALHKLDKAYDMFGHGAGLDFSGGQPQPTRTGKKVSGARNPNFRLRSDWQKPTIIKAARGMHETVNQPTWILAGEAGKERVDIGKPGSAGAGRGGFYGTINVFVDGVQRPARYSMGARK